MLNPYIVGLMAKERREEHARLFSRANAPRKQGGSRESVVLILKSLLTFIWT